MAENAKAAGGIADEGKLFQLTEFKGLNTRSPRMSIDDQEMSWCENFFPIAPGNLSSIYDQGTAIYIAPGGKTVVYFFFYNIGATQYCAVFLNDGTAYQINVATLASTTISNVANTFYTGSTLPVAQQYSNKYLLIANTNTANDYWVWDGTVLYGSGSISPLVNLTQGGLGYASAPTVAISGGSGTGAAITAVVTGGAVTSFVVTNPGSGYVQGDQPQLSFTGGSPSPGVVTGINVINGGTGWTSAPTVTITAHAGDSGSGATATVTILNGALGTFTITAPGSGYKATPTVSFSGGGGSGAIVQPLVSTVAAGTVELMPFGNSGNAIEIFLNRVFLTNAAKAQITDAESLTAFNTTITSTDSFLKNQFTGLNQTNGFIYLFADSSVNDVTNVQTQGTPAITTLNNSNADPQVGTPWRDSIVTFGRDIVFANTNGIYVMYGGAAEKISEKLDGIFKTATLPITGNKYPSAALATIFGIKVYMILMTIVDVFTGAPTPKLLCWDAKKWFIASQASTLTFIGTQKVSSQLTAYGTDGNSIFPLFQTPSVTLMKKGQTKLWSGDSFLIYKQAMRAYLESFSNDSQAVPVSATIDSDTSASSAIALPGGNNLVQIINNGNLYFITNGGVNYSIIEAGISITGADAQQYGRLLGFTFTSTGEDFTIVNLALLYRNQTFYG